ncbi:aspartate--tRNA ligase [Proteocatella sphenisci]|uniref:aspartate--tRNA ligase n=1 Tax=Proteocatella sphenisci TaxID=181070 RepID=UPI00048B2A09|nr:aspartate--tRNA ligase [Proteocatella sphenisci]
METLKGLKRSNYCSTLRITDIDKEVTLMGWIQKSRNLGGLIFADIRDTSGLCQVVFDININKELFEKAETLGSEYVVAVKGIVKERQAKNPNIETGDIEIIANELRILNTSETPPIYIKDDDDVSESLRLKYRYLDLRKPKMQNNLKMRHKVCQIVRNFLSDENFVEIETPVLAKPTPEGARDYLVPSRVNPGNFYGLPQSPQLFKQLLMVSGMDRYFQIVKCFRDEDLRADRQPEFTQIDCEMSFVEMEDVMQVMEKLIQKVFKETINVDVALPLQRMTYKEAMDRFGSDKPDLRFGFEIKDLSPIVQKCGFSVFENALESGGSVRAINVNGYESQFTRKNITELENVAKLFGAKGLAWMKITGEGISSPIAKFMTEETINNIISSMDAKAGDLILFVADKNTVVFNALGHVRIEAAKKLDIIDKDAFNFLYVTEFPLFEFDEEENRYFSMHHPFTSPLDEDFDKFESDPGSMRAKAYDMVLNGVELGGGSIRIYDSNVQSTMFKALGFSEEEAQNQFGFLLDAFKYGTPPHGGLAFGLDRIMMLLLNLESIREVIAFPKNQNAVCPLTNAPGKADPKSLEELNIKFEI